FSTEPLRVFTTEADTIPDIDTSEDIDVYQIPHSLLDELDHDPHLRTHAQPHDIEIWIQAAEQGFLPED
ncbi:MAG: hypothetical protein SVU32_08835, partial [Candidatus Nanohaloarchaea archaeon]|nr:hypothetical protein [Candidatus Nanohaloarchaea archaeon]